MRKSAAITALILALCGCAHQSVDAERYAEESSTPIVQRLKEISGVESLACGRAPLGVRDATERLELVSVCTRQALSTGRPFWAAFQRLGDDSSIWEGVARSPDGELIFVAYDSDIYGGGYDTPQPRMSEYICSSVILGSGFIGSIVQCLGPNNSFKPKPLRGSA
jgi:hypothetical protein